MSNLHDMFQRLGAAGRSALIPYLAGGDPHPEATVDLMRTLVDAGADAVELGIPFSDPMADGPVIQRASERALAHGITINNVLAMVKRFRHHYADVPVVLMGYLNPIEVTGYRQFATRAADAGVDGLITVDMPPEEGDELREQLVQAGIDPIFLLAPNTQDVRIQRICQAARGFVYYVSLRGVTGATHLDVAEVQSRIAAIKAQTDLPVGVGFGIDGPEVAAQVSRFADAVIVGTAVVRRIEEHSRDVPQARHSLTRFVASLRAALDGVAPRLKATP